MLALIVFTSGVLFVLLCAVILRVYQKKTNAKCESYRALVKKTVMVTGGSAGMGLQTAMRLAASGCKMIIAGPNVENGTEAVYHIQQEARVARVYYKHLDLSSLESVRKFANEILETEDRLDILVNNAGVLVPPDNKTADDMSYTMQVNYYGHFLLTQLLLPLMKTTGTLEEPCRIINLSSVLHRFGSRDIENLNRVGYWYRWQIYCNSKLCMAMFTTELSRRLKGANVTINSVDPGAVGTRIYDSCGFIGRPITFLFKFFFKTPLEGAQTAIFLAFDEIGGKVNGGFFKNCKLTRGAHAVYDEQLCRQLWEHTAKLVHFNDEMTILP